MKQENEAMNTSSGGLKSNILGTYWTKLSQFSVNIPPRVGGNGIQHCLWLTKYPLEISASNSQNISHFEPWGELRKDSKLPKYIYYKVVKFFV